MAEELSGRSGGESMDRADDSMMGGEPTGTRSPQEGRGSRGDEERSIERGTERGADRGTDRGRTTADDIDTSMRSRGTEESGEVY